LTLARLNQVASRDNSRHRNGPSPPIAHLDNR
jgi:hypothetical protein